MSETTDGRVEGEGTSSGTSSSASAAEVEIFGLGAEGLAGTCSTPAF